MGVRNNWSPDARRNRREGGRGKLFSLPRLALGHLRSLENLVNGLGGTRQRVPSIYRENLHPQTAERFNQRQNTTRLKGGRGRAHKLNRRVFYDHIAPQVSFHFGASK